MKRIFILIVMAFSLHVYSQEPGKPLPPWQEGMLVFRRITSEYLYEGPRDLFATNMMEAK
ncbi:MAG: hypothetical protein WEB30_14085 [Cyclobacteriaceae bacterium]